MPDQNEKPNAIRGVAYRNKGEYDKAEAGFAKASELGLEPE